MVFVHPVLFARGKLTYHSYLTACGWECAGQLHTEDKCIKLNPRFEVYWLIRMIYSRILTLINPTAPLLNTLKCFISPRCNSFLATKPICLRVLRSMSRCVVQGTEYRNNGACLPLYKCFHIATLPSRPTSDRLASSCAIKCWESSTSLGTGTQMELKDFMQPEY